MLVTRLVCLMNIPIKLPVTDHDLAEVNSTSSACLCVQKYEMHVAAGTHDMRGQQLSNTDHKSTLLGHLSHLENYCAFS
jgi:hypothetical protein